jgi:transcriptional regulator NrdR family protein
MIRYTLSLTEARFASVDRSFEDVDEFRQLIRDI